MTVPTAMTSTDYFDATKSRTILTMTVPTPMTTADYHASALARDPDAARWLAEHREGIGDLTAR